MSRPAITFSHISDIDASKAIGLSHRAYTWKPQSIGIFGLDRSVLLRREAAGHLTLPTLGISAPNTAPEMPFRRGTRLNGFLSHVSFAELVAYELAEPHAIPGFELGKFTFVVESALKSEPFTDATDHFKYKLVPDSAVMETLQADYERAGHVDTQRAIAAIEAYSAAV